MRLGWNGKVAAGIDRVSTTHRDDMSAYQRGRLARRMGRSINRMPFGAVVAYIATDYLHGWFDEDDTLRTGVDNIQAWYVEDMLNRLQV